MLSDRIPAIILRRLSAQDKKLEELEKTITNVRIQLASLVGQVKIIIGLLVISGGVNIYSTIHKG